jgi:hypothetical protein
MIKYKIIIIGYVLRLMGGVWKRKTFEIGNPVDPVPYKE